MSPELKLNEQEKKDILSISKEWKKERTLEKIVDDRIEEVILDRFSSSDDKKEILKFVKWNRFDINSKDFTNLLAYMEKQAGIDWNQPYKSFAIDLAKFKEEINQLISKKEAAIDQVESKAKTEADNHLNEVLSKYDKIKFLADDDANIDDTNWGKNITKFKKADAAAFGGSKNLLAQLGKFLDRAGEEIFVTKIVEKFNKVLESKKLDKISAKNIEELKTVFMNDKLPKTVKADINVNWKNKIEEVSMTSLFVDSISPFTGNLDRYFDAGVNIYDEYKKTQIDISKNPEQAVLWLNIYISENADKFKSDYSNYLKDQRPKDKEEIKKQAKNTKDKDVEKKLKEYAKNPNAIYFNGLVLGYMQHYHTATLQSLDNNDKVTKEVTWTTKADVFTIWASAWAQITKNLTAILWGNATYSGGKITPWANIWLSENLWKWFSASVNAWTLITNLQNISLLIGLTKSFNLSDGDYKWTANMDLSVFAWSDVLSDFIPSAGVRLDRNKMVGIANYITGLRTGLTISISEAISQWKTREDIIARLSKWSGDKRWFETIDPETAKELVEHIYPLIESLDKVEAKTPQEKLQLNTYIQSNIVDNLLTDIATGKYKSSNKFWRGGISFSTNDILWLGVPFLARILWSSFKKNNVRTLVTEKAETKAETKNEKFGDAQIEALNKHFLRTDVKEMNNKFYIWDSWDIIAPKDIKIMLADKEVTERKIDTKKYNISVDKNWTITLSESNNEAKHIDVRLLNERLKWSFTILDKWDSLTFRDKNKKEISISKESIKTNGIKINTKDLTITANPDTDKKPWQIDKIDIKEVPTSYSIDLPLSPEYKTNILWKILDSNKQKTVAGQKLTYDIKYSDHKLYESFSSEMKAEKTNYENATKFANELLAKYNAKHADQKIDHKFISANKNDLLSFFVTLISYEYAVGKVNNPNFDAEVNKLANAVPATLKLSVDKIIENSTKSLHEYNIWKQTALERAKANLSKNYKELYLKLLTVWDIATQSVFKRADGTWIGSRENMVKSDPRWFWERMIHYTAESIKLVWNKRDYESEIIPIGFVLWYPGEKLAANLEVIKWSKVKIWNAPEDANLRKYAFENLVKNVPALVSMDLSKTTIDKDGNMIVDKNTKISVDTLEFWLYAHCNGNHSILATGLKITKNEKIEKSEPILTWYGDLKIEDSKLQTRVSWDSKWVLDIVGGIITSKSVTTVKTAANDETMKTWANDLLGKEVKVTINWSEKTVKIIEIPNSGGKLQMAVVWSATPEVYTLTPDAKWTVTINGKTYIPTKNNTSAPTSWVITGIPTSWSNNTPVTVVLPSNSWTQAPKWPIVVPSSPTWQLELKSQEAIPSIYNVINANKSLSEEKVQKIDKGLLWFINNYYKENKDKIIEEIKKENDSKEII